MYGTCADFEDQYNLSSITDFEPSDESFIYNAVRCFKDPEYRKSYSSYLEGRDIYMIAEFFSKYGNQVRIRY